jgi:demethylmenaquinone methyltransferase/2-methoxy-6-polyprenyl-1,4-benzoquinol methylase
MSDPVPQRFEPHASRAMASMFDGVSGRYDLLNRLMTLGQDRAWREAMWRRVPASAHAVLDLCTGSGVSLPGLRRPGRTVLGIDVSLAMLEVARDAFGGPGWAPRFACADAFTLPLRDASLDAITIAFGVRNLRPRPAALAELARVLRPGGVLVVLEAAAPAPGPLRGPIAFWIRRVIPAAGRLSPDPSAYRYLSESIFEFGSGPEFERDLAGAGFEVASRRAFMLGAARLWAARRGGAVGQNPTDGGRTGHSATRGAGEIAPTQDPTARVAAERRTWLFAPALVSATLTAALVAAIVEWSKVNRDMPLNEFQRTGAWVLLIAGVVIFGLRTAAYALRIAAGRGGG